MGKICDRSPCDPLIKALGHTIFGAPDRGGGFYIVAFLEENPIEIDIAYCPFCGTRLEEVPAVIVEKFMRPRRRRKTEKPPTA